MSKYTNRHEDEADDPAAREARIRAHEARVEAEAGLHVIPRRRGQDKKPRTVKRKPAPVSKPGRSVRCVETGVVYSSIAAAALAAQVSRNAILDAIARRRPCRGRHHHYADEPAPAPAPKRHPMEWRSKPVISDRGEWFPTGYLASQAVGRTRSAVASGINGGWRVAGRHWRHATEADRPDCNSCAQVGPVAAKDGDVRQLTTETGKAA